MSHSNAKMAPSKKNLTVNVSALVSDYDVIPPARAVYCNTAGNLALWGPEDDLSGPSALFTSAGSFMLPVEVRRIDVSATTVTSITLIF